MASFNPLFIGACHRAGGIPLGSVDMEGRFNPLFIGACHRARNGALRSAGKQSFNPLFIGACHRAKLAKVQAMGFGVSIPSSSGHVIGPPNVLQPRGRSQNKFQSPLHRGMSSGSRCFTPIAAKHLVSIPSSSGHVIGLLGQRFETPPPVSFNPLFIGACHRACQPDRDRPGSEKFQSPLHRGMSSGSQIAYAITATGKFQSPLHRGMSSGMAGTDLASANLS